jgi:hypothetical protein
VQLVGADACDVEAPPRCDGDALILCVGGFESPVDCGESGCDDPGGDAVLLLTNEGGLSFALRATFPVGARPVALAARDLNGDLLPDLVTADSGAATISVLLSAP